MALLFIEGFDEFELGAPISQLQYKWNFTSNGYLSIHDTDARPEAGKYIRFDSGHYSDNYVKKLFNPIVENSKFIFGFSMKINTSSGEGGIWSLINSFESYFVKLNYSWDSLTTRWRLNASLRNDSNSTISTFYSDYFLKDHEWFTIEGKIEYVETVHDIDYGNFEILCNGESIINETNVEIATMDLKWVHITSRSGNYTQQVDVDDIYICDGAGTTNNDYLGEIHVRALKPSSDGMTNDFTPVGETENYNCVNALNIDTDAYVKSNVLDNVELFNFDDLPITDTEVLGVFASTDCIKEGFGYRRVKTVINNGTTNIIDTNEHTLANGIRRYENKFEINPFTGNPFTISELNNMQFGITISL